MSKYTLTIEKIEDDFSITENNEGLSTFAVLGILNHIQVQKSIELQESLKKWEQENEKS